MPMRFKAINLWDSASAVTASSSASGFPVANTQNRQRTRHWRATGKSSEWVKANLGSAKAVQAVVLTYTNLTTGATVTLQANSSDSWGSPPYSQGITVTATMASRGQVVYDLSSAQTYQWWRVTLVDSGNPDAYIRIGRVFLGAHFQPTYSFTRGAGRGVNDPSEVLEAAGGSKFVNLRWPRARLRLEFSSITSADRASYEAVRDAVGNRLPFWITLDTADLGGSTYYVAALSDWLMTTVKKDELYRMPLELEEEP